MKIYLSGAITNDPNHKQKFEKIKECYMKHGNDEILSPIETVAYRTKQSNRKCFFESIKLLEQADVLIQIDDPANSRGMQIEEAIADYCGIPVMVSTVPKEQNYDKHYSNKQ